ncbi:MAG TPA: hypothetical protein PKA33_18375 [Amaricoccus sp.]|uniref:hypothetical protein n=1 Tax=Amaricoccus sp. TaxID=1872485 RepID=UPI002C5388EC|nr:hypothetical protein [Amaricoccus sp.]HMQ93197.1 hypothetical protein [Amaricoccus sp.]HMR54322.1 hypothetical protein [Amaricoccus sp.]HMR60467.1 hypothetical protein [Amaricoccus sp.]HMU01313.1 hypothetical protein [Amaricoccus sp.]
MVCDGGGKPPIPLLSEGQASDHRGAATMLPDVEVLIADKGTDSDRFRKAPTGLEIAPCIPGRSSRIRRLRSVAPPPARPACRLSAAVLRRPPSW